MHSLVRWRAMQYKDDYQEPYNIQHMEFMLEACHELLKDTARPQSRRHIVIYIPQVNPSLVESVNKEGREKMWDILGETYNGGGRQEEAEVMHRQALKERKKMLELEHSDALISKSKLGWMLVSQGNYEAADNVSTSTKREIKGAGT